MYTLLCVIAVAFCAPAAAQQPSSPQDDGPTFRWDDHPSIRFGPGTRIDFRARVQTDLRRSEGLIGDDEEEDAGVDLARRRVGIEGEIGNIFDFQVEAELRQDEPWRDVYINYKQFDTVQLQVGKFKLPFSLDENTSATNLDFAYRSRAAEHLAPGRDRGVMVHGRPFDSVLRYEVGVFNHDGRNARTRNPERVSGGRTTAGRIRVQPLRSAQGSGDLEMGVGFTSSDVGDGLTGVRGRTPFEARFYQPNAFVRGQRTRLGLEGQWRPGPASIKAEYMRLREERLGQSVEDTDLSPLVATGWYVSGTWALTGERKAEGLDRPRKPLFRGGFGAIEIAARTEKLSFGSEAGGEAPSAGPRADAVLGNAYRGVTIGVNWYWNRWVKVQANLIRESLRDPLQGPLPTKSSFWSRVLRLQLSI